MIKAERAINPSSKNLCVNDYLPLGLTRVGLMRVGLTGRATRTGRMRSMRRSTVGLEARLGRSIA